MLERRSGGPCPDVPAPRLRVDLPVSVVLGAGAVRGLAHVAVLQVLRDSAFTISEIAGTSVGAIVAASYAALGMSLDSIRETGLRLAPRHLLAWALLRHAPAGLRRRWRGLAGVVPDYIDQLSASSFHRMHNGVERIAISTYDLITKSQMVCHNADPILRLEDAVRGAAALPGLFPSWKCSSRGCHYRLVDGGVINRLPVDVLFQHPFQPRQVLAVDISSRAADRMRNLDRVAALQQQFPDIPIDVLCLDTLGGATVIYRSGYLTRLLEQASATARAYIARLRRLSGTAIFSEG